MTLIVDISYWQQPDKIDYNKLAYAADGFILRTAYGNREDTAFNRHYQELTSRGKPVGCYHFITEYMTLRSQVDTHKRMTDGKTFKLGYWADVELESGADNLTAGRVIEYLQTVDAEIAPHDIYTGNWCWVPIMGSSAGLFGHKKLWIAQYTSGLPTIPKGWTSYWLWQYSSSVRLPGYDGNLDANKFNGTAADFQAWVGTGSVGLPTYPAKLIKPLPDGYPISQVFGANPAWYPTSKGHNGVDWACIVGTPVYAMQDGTVIIAEARQEKTGYGRQVRIQHPEGISIYGHLSGLGVSVGEVVKAGQEIGLSGGSTSDPCSGMSTGPHLHAEYRLTSGAPQVPGGYVYGAIDILPLLESMPPVELETATKAKLLVNLNIRKSHVFGNNVWATAPAGTMIEVLEQKVIAGIVWVRCGWSQWCVAGMYGNKYLEFVE